MLVGAPAFQMCFTNPDAYSLLPADVDGPTPPPVGSPNYVMGLARWNNYELQMYRFHADWDNPSLTTLSGPENITINPVTKACELVGRGRCVPQPGTAVMLESLGARTMYRLAYRNFGDHESLITNQTIAPDDNGGLTSQTKFEAETKVPILGDIPLLGFLFRSTSTTHNDTTVEFHITPTIRKSRGSLIQDPGS